VARAARTEFRVQPLDVVPLDGGTSSDADGPDGKPAEYRWVVVEAPEGEQSIPYEMLFSPADPGIGGREDDPSTPTALFWADLEGTYVLELRVRDNLGLGADDCPSAAARVTIVARQPEGVRVELTWRSEGDADLDLHLRHPLADGWFTAPYDCDYLNPTPDWGQLENPADDPVYVEDRADGGPEIVRLGQPESTDLLGGPYVIGVMFHEGAGPALARVRVFVDGELAWDSTAPGNPGEKALPAPDFFWEAAAIDWPGGRVTTIDNLIGRRP
jgi:hypothetical protein